MNLFDFLSDYKSEMICLAIGALIATIIIVFVIERNKFRWLVKELMKIHSGEPSFFSKKRIESSFAFWFAFWMTTYYLKNNIVGMDIWAFGYVLSVWLLIAGYTVSQIQSEKKLNGNGNEVKPPQNNENG